MIDPDGEPVEVGANRTVSGSTSPGCNVSGSDGLLRILYGTAGSLIESINKSFVLLLVIFAGWLDPLLTSTDPKLTVNGDRVAAPCLTSARMAQLPGTPSVS